MEHIFNINVFQELSIEYFRVAGQCKQYILVHYVTQHCKLQYIRISASHLFDLRGNDGKLLCEYGLLTFLVQSPRLESRGWES